MADNVGISPFLSFVENEANKARAGLWQLVGTTADFVDRNVATPLLNADKAVTGVVDQTVSVGKQAVSTISTYFPFVIAIALLGLVAYLVGPLLRHAE